MNRTLTIWIGAAMLLLATAAYAANEAFPVVHNEKIAVRVLDGKDGKPQTQLHVVLMAGYDKHDLSVGLWRQEALTDGQGMVRLPNAFRNLPLLRVQVLRRRGCEPDSDQAAFSVDRIRRDGLSGANRCGTAVAEDAPGVFTVFVKAPKAATTTEVKEAYSMPLVYPAKP
jgi:hypothetical protein